MTLLDAARQALEALEEFNEVSRGVDAVCLPGEIDTAMDALRQAIEQAEQQEPVAWIEHIAGGVEYNPYHKAALKLPEGMRFDLYTAPPQRKPLSDEEIFEVHKRVDSMQYLTFARAIEAKHGIKENT